jgi:hypothetical protein
MNQENPSILVALPPWIPNVNAKSPALEDARRIRAAELIVSARRKLEQPAAKGAAR